MDARNRFETPATFTLARLEWLALFGVCIWLAITHLTDIRWPVFIGMFVVIDLVGYLPGAVAYRRSRTGRIHRGYYVAYNTMHSLLTGGAMVAIWALLVGPEWALLAVPIHLLGDRGLFGNTLKPFGVSFEPSSHPTFTAFERAYRGASEAPAPTHHQGATR